MEVEEIYNTSVSPLVVTPFALQWSMDNRISLITEKGVHVFELIPTPMSPQKTLKFSRSFINPSDTLPAHNFISELDIIMWKLHRLEVYALLKDEALTPKLDDMLNMDVKITSTAWSPQNLLHPNKCIFAIITSAGALEILHQLSKQWFSVHNLTTCWLNKVEEEIRWNIRNCTDSNFQFEIIKRNIKKSLANAMAWSKLYESEQIYFAYLVVAYCNGEMVIWKINQIPSIMEAPPPLIVFQTNLNKNPPPQVKSTVKTLLWIDLDKNQYLIVIGYNDGQIHALRISNLEGNFKIISLEKYYEIADKAPISNLNLLSQNNKEMKILACKESFLLLCSMTKSGVFKHLQHLQLEGFPITGLTFINETSFLVVTQDSKIFKITIEDDQIKLCQIKSSLPQTGVQYLGLARSPSYCMFIYVTSHNTMNDHLVNREPSILYIFTLIGDNWDPLYVIHKKEKLALRYIWDSIEFLRIRAVKAKDPTTVLPACPQNLESLSMKDLQTTMWISVINEVSKKKKMIQGHEQIVGEISDAQPLIFIRFISSHVERLSNKSILSQDDILSINLLRAYLEVYLAGEDDEETNDEFNIIKKARQTLEIIKRFGSMEIEVCSLCRKIINELSWTIMKCPSGHRLPRCAITLLQVATIKYRSCPYCRRIFHPSLDAEYDEILCIYCDVPAVYDHRVIDLKNSDICKRCLSNQPMRITDASNNEFESQERSKKKVKVDDSLDESGENWKEFS